MANLQIFEFFQTFLPLNLNSKIIPSHRYLFNMLSYSVEVITVIALFKISF
jgi:hypothetical protein